MRENIVEFVNELVEGNTPDATKRELDSLLHWLAGRNNDWARAVKTAFECQGMSRKVARERVFAYLDRTLFHEGNNPHRMFGLEPGCDWRQARPRHRELLQIFHPDRHRSDMEWFTRRTEQINAGYARLKSRAPVSRKRGSGPGDSPSPGPGPASARNAQSHRRRTVRRSRGGVRRSLLKSLGEARRLEKQIYLGLALTLVLLLLIFHLGYPQ